MEDDENINKSLASFGEYSQVGSHLSQGQANVENELEDNLVTTDLHYKSSLPVFE